MNVGSGDGVIEIGGHAEPYARYNYLRTDVEKEADKPMLATRIDAAQVWTHDKGVQVILDGTPAVGLDNVQKSQMVWMREDKRVPALKIVKMASHHAARPGDIIEFTLRFDNIGSDLIGNVTIVDNLTTRLEYVKDSQNCSIKADFLTQPNDGDSLVLRWEIIEPLEAGDGGVIRFKCRVL